MHDTDVPYECVPAALLALLHQIAAPRSTSPSAREARTLLGGDLSATGGGPSRPGGRAAHSAAELRAARGWLLREEDCSGGTPASKVPLRLLHCRLRAAGISTVLLRCGHVDSTSTFEIFRIGAPAAQVERHALLVLQPERSHLVTVSWPPSEGSPVEDVARDASQLSVVGDDHPLLRLRAGGDGPTDASVPSFCASVGIGSCDDDAGGDGRTDASVPSFCASVIGSCDDDGLLHGDECTATLAWIDFEIQGQWQHGLPDGHVAVRPKAGGFSIHLDTERPRSASYGEAPTRVAVGFLWPRPDVAHGGRRTITFVSSEAAEICRTYEVKCLEEDRHLLRLECVDQELDRGPHLA